MLNNFMDKSICKDCKYRVSRIISPEGLDLVDAEGEPLDVSDNIEVYSEICSLLSVDLDHLVLECTAYTSKYNSANFFFKNKDFL